MQSAKNARENAFRLFTLTSVEYDLLSDEFCPAKLVWQFGKLGSLAVWQFSAHQGPPCQTRQTAKLDNFCVTLLLFRLRVSLSSHPRLCHS